MVPVIVGGLLAILGGLAGHFISEWLARTRENKLLIREKGEAIVKALYAHMQWIDDKQRTILFGSGQHHVPSPLSDVRMLQALYFPDLRKAITKLLESELEISRWLYSEQLKRVEDEAVWIRSFDKEPFAAMYQEYLPRIDEVTEAVRKRLNE